MAKRYINIDYPFKNSPDGLFLNLNVDDQRAIKADLMHLLLTNKGQRFYNPDFGTNLLKYIFEPNDTITFNQLNDEIKSSINKYIPKLNVTNLDITESVDSEYAATIRLDYTISDGVFEISDFVIINV